MTRAQKINVWLAAVEAVNYTSVPYGIKIAVAVDVAKALRFQAYRAPLGSQAAECVELYAVRGICPIKRIAHTSFVVNPSRN